MLRSVSRRDLIESHRCQLRAAVEERAHYENLGVTLDVLRQYDHEIAHHTAVLAGLRGRR